MMVDLVDLRGLVVVENESERHLLHINSIFINVNSGMECHPIVGDKQKWTRLSMHSSMHSSDDRDVISKIGNHLDIMPLDPLLVLSPENSVLVEMAARKELLRVWKTVGSKGYSTTLAQMRSKDCADCGIDQRSQSQSEEVTKFECQL